MALSVRSVALSGAMLLCAAGAAFAERPTAFDAKIAELSKRHHVPERLIHRVIMRESRYASRASHSGNFGLMQIRLGTARTMGYSGSAAGLLDGPTNLTYAVPYLANAYVVAGRDEDRAVRLYASGFYYEAKRMGRLRDLQTAQSEPIPVAAYAPAPTNPIAALFQVLTTPAQAAVVVAQTTANAVEAQVQAQAVAGGELSANAGALVEAEPDVPVPPRRPRAYSTPRFVQLAMRADPVADEPAPPPELRRAAE